MGDGGGARWYRGALLPLVALLALGGGATGCDGSKAGGGGAPTLKLACGTYNAGLLGATVVAATIDPPPASDFVLHLSGESVSCRAGERLCISTLPRLMQWDPGHAMANGSVMAMYDTGAGPGVARCTVDQRSRLAQTEGRASAVAGKLEVTWAAVPTAQRYVATFRDLDMRPPPRQPRVLGSVSTTDTHATFDLPSPGTPPELAVVEVEAWATDPEAFAGSVLPAGGANRSVRVFPVIGAPWTLRQPSEFDASGSLTLAVAEGHRLAVIPLNLQGADGAMLTLQASGTSIASLPVAAPRSWAPGSVEPLRSSGRTATGAMGSPARASSPSRTFCTFPDSVNPLWVWTGDQKSKPITERRPATLMLETETALLYVDDDDAAGLTWSDWDRIAGWWEVHVFPALTRLSGPPPDVDGNGRFILFITSALGPRTWSFTNGYDLWMPLDTSPDCTPPDTASVADFESNQADMIHLHPPFGMLDDLGWPLPQEDQWSIVEGRMAYSFQRILDAGRWGMDYPRDTGITFARMSLAETLSGRGDSSEAQSALAAPALFTRAGLGAAPGWGGYPTLRLFPFEETRPHQEVFRAGAASFIRYLADRMGSGSDADLLAKRVVTLNDLEVTTGIPLPIMYALWTGALLFSNEAASPWQGFDYLGPDWTPLHEKFLPLEYAPLEPGSPTPVPLRQNGFDAYVTGVAGPGGGTVTISISDPLQVRPYVVAIPFQGQLP
jgi:hypothetical protein